MAAAAFSSFFAHEAQLAIDKENVSFNFWFWQDPNNIINKFIRKIKESIASAKHTIVIDYKQFSCLCWISLYLCQAGYDVKEISRPISIFKYVYRNEVNAKKVDYKCNRT